MASGHGGAVCRQGHHAGGIRGYTGRRFCAWDGAGRGSLGGSLCAAGGTRGIGGIGHAIAATAEHRHHQQQR